MSIIGASKEDFKPGHSYMVSIRRQISEPYVSQGIYIVREATVEEYIKYHKENNLTWNLVEGEKYYELLMD